MPRTAEDDEHEPNSYGFAGGATAPDPDDRHEPAESPEQLEAERIAIPDDLAELFGDAELPDDAELPHDAELTGDAELPDDGKSQ